MATSIEILSGRLETILESTKIPVHNVDMDVVQHLHYFDLISLFWHGYTVVL